MKLVPMPQSVKAKEELEKLLADALIHYDFKELASVIEKHSRGLAKARSPYHNRLYKLFTAAFTKRELHSMLKDFLLNLRSNKSSPQEIVIAGGQGWEEALVWGFFEGLLGGITIGQLLQMYGWGQSEDADQPPEDPGDYGDNVGDFPDVSGDSAYA